MSDFSLHRDPWQQLVLVWKDGRQVTGVEPVRAFPITAPAGLISICDAEGHELVRIEDLAELPAEVRAVLEEELTRREFIPVVLRIEQVSVASDPSEWKVVTDRGPTTFFMEDSDDDVRRLGPSRVMLVDTHGIHYLIPDARRLDAASRRILDRYL
ncbi:MAG: DUF1854 domain-containing protein [Pirellulales bacterium]|nr:DUF1854 domain-containing protein [Pirellulales bacterium]